LSGTAANAVVPELGVVDLGRSLAFYRDILGFVVAYERPEEGFASIRHEECTLMLDQIGVGRTFQTGLLEPPLGRGLNLQLSVSSLAPILARLAAAGTPLYLPLETRSYRVGNLQVTQHQFCVQDPDGYLLRFCEAA
jgi:catechol 2,3-dioxygenase-like lactoylglutathione lyase family enzyme